MEFKYPKKLSNNELFIRLDPQSYKEGKYSKNYINYIERRFIKEACYAANYSMYFMEKRWIEAEPCIFSNEHWREKYISWFIGNSWPDNEPTEGELYEYWYNMNMNKIFPSNTNLRKYPGGKNMKPGVYVKEVDISSYVPQFPPVQKWRINEKGQMERVIDLPISDPKLGTSKVTVKWADVPNARKIMNLCVDAMKRCDKK